MPSMKTAAVLIPVFVWLCAGGATPDTLNGIAMLTYGATASLRGVHRDIRTLLRKRVMWHIGVADTKWSVGYRARRPAGARLGQLGRTRLLSSEASARSPRMQCHQQANHFFLADLDPSPDAVTRQTGQARLRHAIFNRPATLRPFVEYPAVWRPTCQVTIIAREDRDAPPALFGIVSLRVLGQGIVLSLAGIGIGIAAGFGLTRFLSNLLFDVKAAGPAGFLAVHW